MEENIYHIKTLINKFKLGKCTDDELLELLELSDTELFEQAIRMSFPKDLDQVEDNMLSSSEVKQNYSELASKIGFSYRKPFKYYFRHYAKYAAIFLLPLVLSALSWMLFFSNKDTNELTFAVEKGNKGYFELSDGSKVWLNGNSKIFYVANDDRSVRLDGAAYFEIAHRDEDLFKVKTDYFDIIVYGTSFNVSSYETDEVVEVALVEGSIGIRDKEKDIFKLHPGQMIKYNKTTDSYSVSDRDMTDISLWTNKELVIRDMDDAQLFNKLSSWYQVDIHVLNNDPNKRKYNLVVTNESLENMLELISKLSPLDYQIRGKEVTIRYK